ncbi:STAS domain-containing protein [Flammeovirga yaeyamensis]|uniref:STAS domain-containing protein n=1 Tax=Flammeovirga yaeyamensis TaxID=367791 RepID=A0AAX1NBS0_9BACT|nr:MULTISPECIES: STAS domain-containing protein [Flammeovirga]ANQ52685.1 STAS domain-containing protein [Flammeovirga sp. MY04]MBB3697125.1 rsbT antagonist protein RsbS [Flammeovirga yaeyamensis]NMF33788.1 STAS domain-containing protein [Flammeovirga yaeyamensis]QWG04947.1 STAS domain-containing protein [Flammeovirga yaeyamensis]
MENWIKSSIPLQLHKGCIIASFQLDLEEEQLKLFRQELLNFVVKHNKIRGIIFDLSGLEIIDLIDFNRIRSIIDMIKLTGYQTIISGLKPSVVSSLILLDADIDGLNAVLSLDEAFLMVDQMLK